jgi:hypothetical protein
MAVDQIEITSFVSSTVPRAVTAAPADAVGWGAGGGGGTVRFRMRGWNTVTVNWETWESAGTPNLTPPVGPCVDIGVMTSWVE